MPRHLTQQRLRAELLDFPGRPIQEFNQSYHQSVRDLVVAINEEYLATRKAMLAMTERFSSLGLVLVYDSQIEKHTGLEIGYIRWRYGRYSINKNRAKKGHVPVTCRVTKSSRKQLHYSINDFASVPRWRNAPDWEHRLVMEAELKVRPIREALRDHEQGQRAYLFARAVPEVDFSFEVVE